ncbi:unnamed protein product, partial [Ilex paraguariensis]
ALNDSLLLFLSMTKKKLPQIDKEEVSTHRSTKNHPPITNQRRRGKLTSSHRSSASASASASIN